MGPIRTGAGSVRFGRSHRKMAASAEVVCLGCAGMTGLDTRMTDQLGIPVVDGVSCAVALASRSPAAASPPARPERTRLPCPNCARSGIGDKASGNSHAALSRLERETKRSEPTSSAATSILRADDLCKAQRHRHAPDCGPPLQQPQIRQRHPRRVMSRRRRGSARRPGSRSCPCLGASSRMLMPRTSRSLPCGHSNGGEERSEGASAQRGALARLNCRA
jgi:hypothetical protein